MLSVRLIMERSIPDRGVLCVTIAHNEIKRISDFLRHYRAIGVAHFLIMDDNSTDGTFEFLRTQSDVTLFVPRDSNFKQHQTVWRTDMLDRYAAGRWVMVPDLDELLVYPHCDRCSIGALAAHLEEEGSEAVFAPMVDMYADAPLDQISFQPGQSMLATFPYFDGDSYRLVRPRLKHLLLYPTPPLEMHGGARERLFYDFSVESLTGLRRLIVKRFTHLGIVMSSGFWSRVRTTLARIALSGKAPRPPLVMSKLSLMKWREGMRFSGGPHCVSQTLKLSPLWGAYLHFKFIDLPKEVAYQVERGQHAGGAVHYKKVAQKAGFERSAIYKGSRRYESWRDLLRCGLLRTTPDWDRAAAPLEIGGTAPHSMPARTEIVLPVDAPSPHPSREKQPVIVPVEH
jgi:hypothetical protein